MRLTREVALAAPSERVWEILWDVPRMVTCVPGCVEAREVEPRRRYQARMSCGIGLLGGLCLRLAPYVTGRRPEATRGDAAVGGC